MRAGTTSPRIIATSALDRLYQIDTPAELKECLNDFLTAVKGSFRTLSKKDEDALIAAVTTGEKPISPELYQRYADNFRRAVDAVPIDNIDLSAQWHANVSRFAAYKSYHATEELRRLAVEEQGDMAILRAVLHKYNRYQAAEYNTAVARARTGKQWLSFNDPDNARLFPYIEWLPSRSATPREAHRIFWNCRWPKGDPFWKENQPGTLWNCKCDWQETDEEPDPQKNKTALDKAEEMKQIAAEAHKPNPLCLPGLDKNPATSGQIFTETAPYISSCSKTLSKKIVNAVSISSFRAQCVANIKPSLNKTVDIDLNGSQISVKFDNTTRSHISNDMAINRGDFLMLELTKGLPDFLKRSKLIAHEANTKITKKPSALHYYYFSYTLGGKTYYLHVEENFVALEKRHFYRLYSITDTLRDSALMY